MNIPRVGIDNREVPRKGPSKPPPIPQEALHTTRPVERKEQMRGIEIGAATKASLEHPDRNEDAAYYSRAKGLMFVGDGMGGVPAGEFASGAAASIMSEKQRAELFKVSSPEDRALLIHINSVFNHSVEVPLTQDAVEGATHDALVLMNKKIEQTIQTHPKVCAKGITYFEERFGPYNPENPDHVKTVQRILSSVGTTGTLTKTWKTVDGQAFVTAGSVGDSRAYILRNGGLIPLTKDHSPLQILLDAKVTNEKGEILDGNDISQTIDKKKIIALADQHPELQQLALKMMRASGDRVAIKDIRNMVYLALGGGTAVKKEKGIDFQPSIITKKLELGDVIIVASDGLLDNVSDRRIAITAQVYAGDPAASARALQEEATEISASNDIRAKKDDVTVLIQEFHG